MSRIAYVNGRYVPHARASVHIEDRGYQFADGVYEVIAVSRGHLIDATDHMARLERSLAELSISWPMAPSAMRVVMGEVIRRNHVRDGIVYLQITRGVAARNHAFPDHANSALVMTAKRLAPLDLSAARRGVSVITIPDIRWRRRDIKSISLLPNCLGKQQARQAGAYEAWLVDDDGTVNEGTSSNAWIVDAGGDLVTRPLSYDILNGITRIAILAEAKRHGIPFVERAFSVDEALAAREALITSTTSFVKPVIEIDGRPVGGGKPGPLARKLLEYYEQHMQSGENAPGTRQ